MDAGLLDMLHQRADVNLLAVADAVDIDFQRVFEEGIDHQRPVGDSALEPRQRLFELRLAVEDFHGATAEYIAGADHDWEAERLRHPREILEPARRHRD